MRAGRCCWLCHAGFVAEGTNCTQVRYCSDGCRRVAANHRRHPRRRAEWGETDDVDCLICCTPFRRYLGQAKRSHQLFCSRKCKRFHDRVEMAWDILLSGGGRCRHCAKVFWPRKRAFSSYCSRACYFAAKRGGSVRPVEGSSERANYRKRARVYGVRYEPVDRERVFTRDGWRCKCCGGRVHRDAPEHRGRPSLDHIIPMSSGGPHTYDNVQLMHVGCNSAKHTGSVGSQLQFLGAVL